MNEEDEYKLQMAALAKQVLDKRAKDKVGSFKPYDKQSKYINSEYPIVIFQAGNRSGKTCIGIVDDILFALGRHPHQTHEPPVIIWVVGVDFTNHVKSVLLPTLFEWLPEDEIDTITKDPPIVKLKNGSQIFFKSADSGRSRFQGAKIHRLHVDEEIAFDVVEECQARLIDYGGHFRITATPITGIQWLRDLSKQTNVETIRASMLDNPHINEEYAKEFLSGLPEGIRATREAGDFLALSGIIYPEIQDPIYWVKPHEYPVHRDSNIVMALDPGFRVTACLWAEIKPDDSIVIFQEYYGKEKSVIENAKAIISMERHISARITQRLIDPASRQRTTSPNSTREQYKQEGLTFDYAENDVLAGIFEVKNYLNIGDNGHPRLKFWNTLTELREEFDNYIWEAPGKSDKEAPRKGRDHALDVLRYLVFSKPEYKTQEKLRKSWLKKEIGGEEKFIII